MTSATKPNDPSLTSASKPTAPALPDFFTVSKAQMAAYLLTLPSVAWPLWVSTAAGVALTAAGAIADVRVMVLGLMVGLCATPVMAFFIFFSKMLDPAILVNLMPHTVEKRPDGYLVVTYRKQIAAETEGDKACVGADDEAAGEAGDKCAGKEKYVWIEAGRLPVPEAKVVRRVERIDFSVLHLAGSPVSLLCVPR